jgi:two-component system, LytTR family, response regulator
VFSWPKKRAGEIISQDILFLSTQPPKGIATMVKQDLHILIVDDDPRAINILKELLKPFEEVRQVLRAESVDEGIEIILNQKPNLVFLDIDMPGKNGFELIHELKTLDLHPTIIFQTAFPDYTLDAMRHEAFDYLTKPINPIELKKAIRRFQCNSSQKQEAPIPADQPVKITFSVKGGTIFINPDDIFYITAEGSYSEIFFTNGQTRVVTMLISRVLELLPKKSFIRISRSTIINTRYLTELDHKKRLAHLAGNAQNIALKVSRSYLKDVEGCF